MKKQIIVGIAIVAMIILAVIIGTRPEQESAQATEEAALVQAGVTYLQQLESQSTDTVEAELKEIRKQERIAAIANGEVSVWEQLEDAVILGDSRAVGFYYYEYMDESRVLAEAGSTIRKVSEHLEDLRNLNPSQVFICYGINDVSIGFWSTPEEYVAEMAEVMQSIWEVVPETEIFINSILIARDPAFSQSTAWYDIPEFNDALKAFCEENGYHFVDNTNLCDEYAELWDIDGIHVQYAFYPYWGANLVAAIYDAEDE